MIVVREVRRRASSDAAANLGIQHHQSTSSNSAVPTVMLVTTSLIYVLLQATSSLLFVVYMTSSRDVRDALLQYLWISDDIARFVFAYNFYVYLITGKQFRSELLKLFCCRSSSSSSSSAAAAAVGNAIRVARHGQADTTV